jgi:maltooligosyltrehalose trehalohydrolase
MTQSAYSPPTWGAWHTQDGLTRFRIWAPHYTELHIKVNDAPPVQLHKTGSGWHEISLQCAPGSRYVYQTPHGDFLPDPASAFQPEDVHGPSQVIDHNSYSWRALHWRGRPWEETVIYELHVGAAGGYEAIIQQLDQLAELGVTAIELMPLAEFPGNRNWGYDGVFPYAPESSYGTPDDLKRLIDAAHGRRIMVFLDVVYNHFGPEGNILSQYIPEFFRTDRQTPWGQAIDFTLPSVQDYFVDNALYWLNVYKFDGLRLDAVHAIFPQSWLRSLKDKIRAQCSPERYIHLILENENNDADLLREGYSAQWNDDAHNALHVLLTGEGEGYYQNFLNDPTASLVKSLEQGFVYQGEKMPSTGRERGQVSSDLSPTSFIFFLQNHDQIGNRAFGDRLTSLVDENQLSVARSLLFLCPHIPMIFMGDEWGTKTPFLYFVSHSEELNKIVREGRRKEMASFKSFNNIAEADKIPDPGNPNTFQMSCINWKQKREKPYTELYEQTRELLSVRAEHICPRLAGCKALSSHIWGKGAFSVSWKMGDDRILELLVNFTNSSIELKSGYQGIVLYRSNTSLHDVNTRIPPSTLIATLREGAET